MNALQRYVLNSLFERNQITEKKLAKALDTFSNEAAINNFLTVLIDNEEEVKQINVCITGDMNRKLPLVKLTKECFSLDLKEAKDLVDAHIAGDELIFPLNTVYTGDVENLNILYLKEVFYREGFEFNIIQIFNYIVHYLNYMNYKTSFLIVKY